MGEIGCLIAKRAFFGFDMEIIYHNTKRNHEAEVNYAAKYMSLIDLLKVSDFVCMMVPLTPGTKKMIEFKHFKQMKKSAIFINASRGETVNELDLIKALNEKLILGAALDVFTEEPILKNNPLLKMHNVVVTPHIGASTVETISRMSQLATENLLDGLRGRQPKNLL